MFVPGVLFALALLYRTDFHFFEIVVIGFIFGLIPWRCHMVGDS